MQFIVSSRVLKEALNELPNRVNRVMVEGGGERRKIRLYAGECFARIECHTRDAESFTDQSNRRWDWVKDLMNQVNDQPITVEVLEKQIRIIFHY